MNYQNQTNDIKYSDISNINPKGISLETELSGTLYKSMKDFVLKNPTWDQYQLINSALATFLVQNGCNDRSVTEIYINQLFNTSKAA